MRSRVLGYRLVGASCKLGAASLTWTLVTFTIAIISEHSLGLPLSQTVYSKLASPLKPGSGVKVMSPLASRETWPFRASLRR